MLLTLLCKKSKLKISFWVHTPPIRIVISSFLIFINPSKILFIITLVRGTIISVSSRSWFGVWIGLEVNLLSFIPVISNSNNQRSTEAALKYFLTQAFGSVILLTGVIILSSLIGLIDSTTQLSPPILIINSAILLKIGAAPFHLWFPVVIEGLSWINVITLITWQKLAPLTLLFYNLTFSIPIVSSTILLSAIVGAVGGLNQTLLRKIISYSSINHMRWIIASIIIREDLWILYFVLYSLLSITVVLSFVNINIFHINQIHNILKNNNLKKAILSANFLSLGGLPPFIGFIPKWLIIQDIIQNGRIFILIVIVISSLLTLFYYLRIIYISIVITSRAKKMYIKNTFLIGQNSKLLLLITAISILRLPITRIYSWIT